MGAIVKYIFELHKLKTWGRFHKAKMLAFFYWRENANKIVLATNIRQHVVNLTVFVALFGIMVAHFGVVIPLYYEIEL